MNVTAKPVQLPRSMQLASARGRWWSQRHRGNRKDNLREGGDNDSGEVARVELRRYEAYLAGVSARFIRKPGSYHIAQQDDGPFRQTASELVDLFNDTLPSVRYAREVRTAFNEGIQNIYNSPSLHCVEEITRTVRTAIVRVERNPELVEGSPNQPSRPSRDPKKVFIIHGHDEAKRRELEAMLRTQFQLTPIVLADQSSGGAKTVIS